MKTSILPLPLLLLLIFCSQAGAVDVSTHCFSNCAFPDSGQTKCYDNAGTPVIGTCPRGTYGQDGDFSPSAIQPRYTIYNPTGISSVTLDNLTGLMWITNPGTDAGFGTRTILWESALTSCTVTMNNFGGTGYAGYKDWRLPNVREALSIVNYAATSKPCIDTTFFLGTRTGASTGYWTSTTCAWDSSSAWIQQYDEGNIFAWPKTNNQIYVRCVRGGPP